MDITPALDQVPAPFGKFAIQISDNARIEIALFCQVAPSQSELREYKTAIHQFVAGLSVAEK